MRARLGLALVAALASLAFKPGPPLPISQRVAQATAIYAGKVTGFAEKTVPAPQFKDDDTRMKIATVRVSETLLGKGMREIKIGFLVPGPAGRKLTGYGAWPELGQEGAFFVHKHPTAKGIHVFIDRQGVVSSKDSADELAETRRLSRILARPMEALKAKGEAARVEAVGFILGRYGASDDPKAKREDVTAEESVLILRTLADADWKSPGIRGAFAALGLKPADGWTPPKNLAELPDAARKWLKENAGKYRVKRLVRDEGGPGEEPGAKPG